MNSHHLNENFDFNPKNCKESRLFHMNTVVLITDKPMAAKHSFGMGTTQEDQEALKKKLETLTSIPKRKYPYPITSAQEVGWDNDEVHFKALNGIDVRGTQAQVRLQQGFMRRDQVRERLRDHDSQEPLHHQGETWRASQEVS